MESKKKPKKNPNIKKYDVGTKGLYSYQCSWINKTPAHLLKIVTLDDGCVFAIYKYWNKYAKRWYYEGRKLTELLYWNALLWGLNKDEQRELFKVNGFDLDNLL